MKINKKINVVFKKDETYPLDAIISILSLLPVETYYTNDNDSGETITFLTGVKITAIVSYLEVEDGEC